MTAQDTKWNKMVASVNKKVVLHCRRVNPKTSPREPVSPQHGWPSNRIDVDQQQVGITLTLIYFYFLLAAVTQSS